jgi:hypothetical protein
VSGTTNFSQYVDRKKSGEVLQKKYIHVVRKVLLCQWLMAPSTSDTWPPPLLIAELLKATVGLEDADVVNSGSSAAFPQPKRNKCISKWIILFFRGK